MSTFDEVVHRPSSEFVESTNVYAFMERHGIDDYDELIERTTGDGDDRPDAGRDWFWDEVVDTLGIEFYEDYDAVRDDADGPQFTEWYPGGTINAAHNVLDRHAAPGTGTRNHAAILWEGEDGTVENWTFHDLDRAAGRVANALVERGVGVGDTVGIYMPMVPEVVAALYGCLRAGAVAVPVFSGFGRDAVATRLDDADCSVLLTADGFSRRGDPVRLKDTADAALGETDAVDHVVVLDHLGADVPWDDARDERWAAAVGEQSPSFETRELDADAPAMLLYSSGTTGRPKGIVQTHAGALVQSAKEIYFGFDHRPGDRFFWLSDVGWMMGPWTLLGNHTFGGTVLVYEGAPDYPDPDRLWRLVEDHGLTTLGLSPTAVRALRRHGDEWVERRDLSSLRLLGSTGEPWDPASWRWFYQKVGGGDTPIINISGGTEICGCFLMPMPIQDLKPCTLGGPGLGMAVDVVDEDGESVVADHERGYLVARDSCPSMTKSLWEGDERYLEEYWSTWEDVWDHGDWAMVDEDGYWYLFGRADDALNVAGRKVGPAEVESALVEHGDVTQAAAVGVPDDTTGTAVVTYVVLGPDATPSEGLRRELRDLVGESLGRPFRPRDVLFVPDLPRTESGKVVRRAVAASHRGEDPGDLSTIENPAALDAIREASEGD